MNSKKKILILIDWYLPGTNAGGPVRSIHALVMHLRNEYDFYILTTDTDLGETKPYDKVQPNTWIEKDGYNVKYLSAHNINKYVIAQEMLSQDYHHIYLNSLYSKWFSIVPLLIARKNKIADKIILAPRGMLGTGALAIKSIKKRAFLRVAKTLGWFKRITWHATVEHEKNDIYKRISTKANIILAPNLSWIKVVKQSQRKKESGQLNLFFLSRIALVKNLHLALEILKDIPAGNNISYHLFGPMEDELYWGECKKIIKQLPSHIKVEYKGTIEHDKLPGILANYHALFMPTSNENFGHSIIESLANGCPVLISDQTPWRYLEKKYAGADIALTDINKFRSIMLKWCASNQQYWNELEKGATDLAKDFLDNIDSKKQYLELFG